MAIVQISKIQVRTGAEDDLPQLATGEIGFCTDTRRAFIGNDPNIYPPANSYATTQTEILTSSSTIPAQGNTTEVQFNSQGVFAADSGFTYNPDGNGLLSLAGNLIVSGSIRARDTTITGNLEVQGNVTYINQGNLLISDPIIELNTSNTGKLPNTAANYSPGLLIHTYSNANTDGNTYIGWSGPISPANANASYGNVSNTVLFGTSAEFANSTQLSNITLTKIAADSLKLTSNANTALTVNNGGITVFGNASIANGNFTVTTNTSSNLTVVSIRTDPNVTTNIGGIEFNNGNVNLANGNVSNGTFIGTFMGNIMTSGNSNIGIGGNVGDLLYNLGGNISPISNINFTAGTLTLGNSVDLSVNGGDIRTTSTTASLFNETALTVSIAGNATTLNLGGVPTGNTNFGTSTINGNANIVNLLNTTAVVNFATGPTTDTVTIGTNANRINIGRDVNLDINGNLNSPGIANFSGLIVDTINLAGNINGGASITINEDFTTTGGNGSFGGMVTIGGTGPSITATTVILGIGAKANVQQDGLLRANNVTVTGNVRANDMETTTINITDTAADALTISGGLIVGNSITMNSATALLTTRAITTGAAGTTGTITGTWSLGTGSQLRATYADLAEYYEGDAEYEAGTVLVFGGDKEVTTTTEQSDTRVAGVVSTNAAYTMNQECQGTKILIALQGRVPCKVIGQVTKGEMLTTSDVAGYAVRALQPKMGSIIGKALENKIGDQPGVIEVAVGRF